MRAVMGGLLCGDYTGKGKDLTCLIGAIVDRVACVDRDASPSGFRGDMSGLLTNAMMKIWDADSMVSASDLGERRLLYYSSIIQKLDGVFILAVFPHQ